jgi:ATP-dependent DNA helicase RecG
MRHGKCGNDEYNFIRLRNWLKDYPELEYQFSDLNNFLLMKLYVNKKYTKKDLERDLEKDSLSENQRKMMDLIRTDIHITQKKLSESIGINAKNIQINIVKLKAKGLLERIGPDKGGYWKVK